MDKGDSEILPLPPRLKLEYLITTNLIDNDLIRKARTRTSDYVPQTEAR